MLVRFADASGRRLRIDVLAGQKMVGGNQALAEELADRVSLRQLMIGDRLIEQGGQDNDLYFVFVGTFDIVVNGRKVATRGPGDHVGEMAAIEPTQTRSASVIASEPAVVAQLSEADFSEIGSRYPNMFRHIARELSRRLLQRNALVNTTREKVRLFIISSAESLKVSRIVQNAFEHDQFLTQLWTDGVFKVANYPLESLESAIDDSDFAVAIAHADDLTESRGKDWPSPRDNVIFELGLFMGRLGRSRAILMEPRDEQVKLPSDLAGITTISYRFESGKDAAMMLAPACNTLREHIEKLGPRN